MEEGNQPQRRVAGGDGVARSGNDGERRVGRRRDDRMIATDPITRRAVDAVALAARSGLPVLVLGPPGSGRSFFARAVHAWGGLDAGRFEEFACRATPQPLQERALFGCDAGALGQLPEAHVGALERAANGTVVIEDIDALSPKVHERLVRAMAERRFRRLGGGEDLPLRARVVATTSHPLESPAFGELSCHEIVLAPLAARREEILPLATHFLSIATREEGVQPVGFTREARAALVEEPWLGNLTELRERIRQAVRLSQDGAISAEALMLSPELGDVPSFRDAKRAFETRYVTTLLRRCGGNVSQAARLAKKDRKDFYDVIRRTGVRPSDFRS